jgi:hypothetical protein
LFWTLHMSDMPSGTSIVQPQLYRGTSSSSNLSSHFFSVKKNTCSSSYSYMLLHFVLQREIRIFKYTLPTSKN